MTSFFLLSLTKSEAESCSPDQSEVVSAEFALPSAFLAKHRLGEIILIPPTWLTLTELNSLGHEGALRSKRSGKLIEPTLVPDEKNGGLTVALPGDFEHHEFEGSAAPMRRIVVRPGQPFQWVDTINGTDVPSSSL